MTKIRKSIHNRIVHFFYRLHSRSIFSLFAVTSILLLPLAFSAIGSPADDPLTSEERKWLREHNNQVRIGINTDIPPIGYKDPAGELSGTGTELCLLLEKKLGMQFKYVTANTWATIKQKLLEKQIDMAPDVFFTEERTKHLLFTEPYYSGPNVILVRNSTKGEFQLKDLSGKKVTVGKEYRNHEFIRNHFPDINISPQKNIAACLRNVATGDAFAAVVSLQVASYYVEAEGLVNLRVAGETIQNTYHLASRNDWPLLNSILNKGLDLITEKEKNDIYHKWNRLHVTPFYKMPIFWKIVAMIIVSVGGIIFIILTWNKKLHQEVKKRTVSLKNKSLELDKQIQVRIAAERELTDHKDLLENILTNIKGKTFRIRNDDLFSIAFNSDNSIETVGKKTSGEENAIDYINTITHEDDRAKAYDAICTVFSSRIPAELEIRSYNVDGSVHWFYTKLVPIFEPNGQIKYADGFAHDITSQKIMEEHFTQSQKMEAIGVLAGGIAHDFNNILGGILGFSELLQEDLKKLGCSPKMRTRNENVIKAGTRAKELVAQILAFSRSEGKQVAPLNLVVIAKEIIRLLQATLPKNITIKSNFLTQGMVLGDVTRIHQILLNLCTNAGHAMKENGGTLTIGIKSAFLDKTSLPAQEEIAPGQFFRLTVQDEGHGISPDIISEIMQPFYTTKPKGEGTGMGLWVTSNSVRDLGGFINISSELEKGSTFDVYLPAYMSGNETTDSSDKPIDLNTHRGNGHILFIDDEATLTQLAKEFLPSLGYEVTTFNSAVMALENFKARPDYYDIIITDLNMPEMTGVSLCKNIRQIKSNIPTILITGVLDAPNKENLDIFDSILHKPVPTSLFAQTIRTVLDR